MALCILVNRHIQSSATSNGLDSNQPITSTHLTLIHSTSTLVDFIWGKIKQSPQLTPNAQLDIAPTSMYWTPQRAGILYNHTVTLNDNHNPNIRVPSGDQSYCLPHNGCIVVATPHRLAK